MFLLISLHKGNQMTFIGAWRFITFMLASFSLSLSMTHLLELPQRMQFDQQLWVRVTVLENLYQLFGSVGAAFECPLNLLARKYSNSKKDNFDIYLPSWLAKYTKSIYTTIFAIIFIITIYQILN